jgi:hypothetical protein
MVRDLHLVGSGGSPLTCSQNNFNLSLEETPILLKPPGRRLRIFAYIFPFSLSTIIMHASHICRINPILIPILDRCRPHIGQLQEMYASYMCGIYIPITKELCWSESNLILPTANQPHYLRHPGTRIHCFHTTVSVVQCSDKEKVHCAI